MSRPRALITGIGVTCALGRGRAVLAEGLRSGRSGIGPLTLFPAAGPPFPWAGQCADPDGEPALSRTDRLALDAARDAVADAALLPRDLASAALIVGSGGSPILLERLPADDAAHRSWRGALAAQLIAAHPSSTTDALARHLGIEGYRTTVMTACSSSATAIGMALDLIRQRRVERVLVGGAEALSQLTFCGFSALKAMAPDPCRPFHADRRGLTLGEGAAMLVVEEAQAARGRGVQPLAELCGFGVSAEGYHMTSPAPDGRGALAAMSAALADARARPDETLYVNAHGTATVLNDAAEAAALAQLLGDRAARTPVSSTKGATGHTLSAAGALETAICALALHARFAPATLRLDRPDPAFALDHVTGEARAARFDLALSNSFAFGGHNTSIALRGIR